MILKTGNEFGEPGFTLLELLIVLLIISITLGFMAPAFRKTFQDIQLNSSAQDIVSLSRYAQERAIVENTALRLNIDAENGTYWLTQKEQDKDIFNKLAGSFSRQYSLAEGLKIETEGNVVDFYPDGEIGHMKIKITNPNNKCLVIKLKPGTGSNIVATDEFEK